MVQSSDPEKWTWFGIAFNDKSAMIGGDAIAVEPAFSVGKQINRYHLGGYTSEDCNAVDFVETSSLHTSFVDSSTTTLYGVFSRPLSVSNGTGFAIQPSDDYNVYITWAWGYEGFGAMSVHTSEMSGAARVSLTRGAIFKNNVALVVMHGIVSIFAVACIPAVLYIQRYMKDSRREQAYQYLGYLVGAVGMALGFALSQSHFQEAHGGISVVCVALIICAEVLRIDYTDMLRFTALMMGGAAVYSGIQVSEPYYPSNSKAIVASATALFTVCIPLVAALFILREIQERRVAAQSKKQVNTMNPIITVNALRKVPIDAWE